MEPHVLEVRNNMMLPSLQYLKETVFIGRDHMGYIGIE
jgi:hypothetical protein